ncbi:MAG TPA: SdrD B-like domain-containing protein, partial [Blastocatellia bacterium]|nr:SdrD B-like domain-containing protein [Blastocatellia bacterium]
MRTTILNFYPRLLNCFKITRRRCTPAFVLLIFALVVATAQIRGWWSGQAAAGTIKGTVFQDYNANGKRDDNAGITNAGSGNSGVAIDRGLAEITVTAYSASAAVAGTAKTDAQGNYSLTASGDAPYRVEFTNLPAGFKPGPSGLDSGTTVQFVSANTADNVSLGLVLSTEYCQDNPTLVTGCYVGGDQNTNAPGMITFPYSAGSARDSGAGPFVDFDQPSPGLLAQASQVGTTWGIGYARSARQVYVGAFMKKHAGFGPAGTGAIYKISLAGKAVSVYADLNAIFGADTAGANPHDTGNYDTDNGNSAWNAVGKTSLGGLAVSDDEKKLYVMNLADRQLYELPLDAMPDSGNIRRRAVPLTPPFCRERSDVRPFAVNYHNGQIYVGMVCS